jgi:hypothetical protein
VGACTQAMQGRQHPATHTHTHTHTHTAPLPTLTHLAAAFVREELAPRLAAPHAHNVARVGWHGHHVCLLLLLLLLPADGDELAVGAARVRVILLVLGPAPPALAASARCCRCCRGCQAGHVQGARRAVLAAGGGVAGVCAAALQAARAHAQCGVWLAQEHLVLVR